MFWFRSKHRIAGGDRSLDDPLFPFGDSVPYSSCMATEGVFCCAELGWGKTWLVFQRFLDAYLRVMGGWILGAKAEDLEAVQRCFERNRALDRLTVLRPGNGKQVNWLGALAQIAPQGAVTEEVVGGLTSLMEIKGRSAGGTGSDDNQFFKTQSMQLLSALVTLLRLAGEPLSAFNIYQGLTSLPLAHAQIASEEWRQTSYACQCLEKAYQAAATDAQRSDVQHAKLFLFAEMVDLNDRTRSSIVSSVSAMLSPLLRGWMREMWSTTSNVDLAEAFNGHWFYIDTSPLEFGEYGISSLVMIKHLVQRMVMRRKIDFRSNPVALMFDEAQAIFVTADRDYQAVCRSKLACTWAASQNVTGLFAALGGGQAAESVVKSWLALFGCKVFGTNTDWDTNSYASQLCGQTLQQFGGWSVNHAQETTLWDRMLGRSNLSTSMSERYEASCRPEIWVRLRKPVPPQFEAEAIVVMARLQEKIGRHWQLVTFTPAQ